MRAVLDPLPDVQVTEVAIAPRSRRGLGRAYWRLWSASAVSNLGDGLALVAFPVAAATLTSNPTLVAGVLFAQRLPWLLLALPAGALADRLNRARAMSVVDLVRGVVLVAVAAAAAGGTLSIAHLYAAALVLGSLETLFAAAGHAAVPGLVADDDLDRANGYLYATETGGAELLGPALGGVAFAAAVGLPFALDGATFLISALLLLPLARRLPAPGRAERTSLRADIADGLRYFRGHQLLRLVAALVASLAFLQSMVMAILVLFATQELGLSTSGYGLFLAAGAVGSVAGGLAAGRIRARVGAATTVTGAAGVAAAGYLLVATTTDVGTATAGFAAEAFAVACGNVATLSLRQALVPDHLRGRVGNVFRLCIWGGIPLGALAGGVVAAAHGTRAPILVAGVVQVVVAVATARRLRSGVRRAEEPVIDLTRLQPA